AFDIPVYPSLRFCRKCPVSSRGLCGVQITAHPTPVIFRGESPCWTSDGPQTHLVQVAHRLGELNRRLLRADRWGTPELAHGLVLGGAPVAITPTLVFNILMGGALTGAAFNPARALGPMIVTGNLGDAWLYGLAPIVGAIIAAVVHLGLSVLTHEQPAAVAAPAE